MIEKSYSNINFKSDRTIFSDDEIVNHDISDLKDIFLPLGVNPKGVIDTYRLYLSDIEQYPVLTPKEELDVVKDLKQTGEVRDKAIETLWLHNQKLVMKVAINEYKKKTFDKEVVTILDLINDGNIGLFRSIVKFDPDRNLRFCTYAVWWIRLSIIRGIKDNGRLVRLPEGKISEIGSLNQKIKKLKQDNCNITIKEIAEKTGYSIKAIKTLESYQQGHLSIDNLLEEEVDYYERSLHSKRFVLPHRVDGNVEENIEIKDTYASFLKWAKTNLKPKEYKVLLLKNGCVDGIEWKQVDIASKIGVTHQRVKQINDLVIKKAKLGFGIS